jgi:hypothetical protein
MTGLTLIGLITFIIVWVIISIQLEAIKKLKQEMSKEVNSFKQKNHAAGHDLNLTQFRLREVGSINKDYRSELSKLKSQSTFVRNAIKEKVSKKKIRGKRRKSA